ncbi:MAG: hypothetical protein JXB46_00390 [Candidatus Eisenbacteria bacterium]|nr:hypothetical protein [Candidatus Eisenbacteria bacterium]
MSPPLGPGCLIALWLLLALLVVAVPAQADDGDDGGDTADDLWGDEDGDESADADTTDADEWSGDEDDQQGPLTAAHPERFQGGSDTGASGRGPDGEWQAEFHPVYKLDHVRDQDVSSWTHDFVLSYPVSQGIAFRATSNINTRTNDALARLNRQEIWTAGLDVNVTDAIVTGLKFRRNTYEDTQNIGASNETTSNRAKETVSLTTNYHKTHFSGVAVSLGATAGLEKNKYTNVRSRGSTQGITAGLGYSPTGSLSTDFTYAGNHSLLDSRQGQLESTDESYDHSLTGRVQYGWNGQDFKVDLRRSMGINEYPKQEQTEVREHEGEGTRITASLELLESLGADLSFDYSRNQSIYKVEPTRNSDVTTRGVSARISYDVAGVQFKANLDSEKKRSKFYDVQTGDTYTNALTTDLSRNFGEDLRVALRGRIGLLSLHYDDIEANDQDRDLFNREVSITVDYDTVANVTTGLVVRVKEDQLIYIRRTRTGDNKTTQRYSIEPFARKSFTPRFSLTQRYALSADYTFYDFDKDANFLVRNLSITSSADWRPFDPLRLNIEHTYRTQDEGAYVEDDAGVEAYGKDTERVTQKLAVGLRYTIAGRIDIEVKQDFGVQEKWSFTPEGKVPSWDTFDTSIVGKASTEYSLDDGTTITATVARTHRDATSISDRQREVWNISLNLNRTF